MKTLFTCPVCKGALELEDRRYVCDKNHSFDMARQGYVNLLPSNHKKSKAPGDTAEMLQARGDFLNAGYYNPLLDKLVEVIRPQNQHGEKFTILDVGCGEGFFLSGIRQAIGQGSCAMGTDISKPAIIQAARRDREIEFAVAGSFRLPVASESLDCILRMFAPGDNNEVVRCLKKGGSLITVTPGPRHLFSMKQMVYKTPKLHELKLTEIEGMERSEPLAVHSQFTIDNATDLKDLLVMTPYYWNGDREVKEKFDALTTLETEADFVITTYKKL